MTEETNVESPDKQGSASSHCYDADKPDDAFSDLSEREIQIALAGAFNAVHGIAWLPMPCGQEGEPTYAGRDNEMFERGYRACWESALEMLLPFMEDRIRETKRIEVGEWHKQDQSS